MGSPKKVEFASTHLEPIDSEAPTTTTASSSQQQPGAAAHQHSGSGAWDTETGAFLIFYYCCLIFVALAFDCLPLFVVWLQFSRASFFEFD